MNLYEDTHLADFREDLSAGVDPHGETLDDLIDTWDALDTLHRELGVVRDEWANVLGLALAAANYVKRDGITSEGGVTVHHTTSRTWAWDGVGIIRKLALDLVDPQTGETYKAVPTGVLEDTVAGVRDKRGDPAGYSSWRTPALRNLDVDPDDYRTVSKDRRVVQRGGMKR